MLPKTLRACRTASTTLPSARLAFRANHRRALADAPQRLAPGSSRRTRKHGKGVLVDVKALIGGRQDFGLVDKVHAQRLQDLRLDKVADARFRHHRIDTASMMPATISGSAHARHAAVRADVGGHSL